MALSGILGHKEDVIFRYIRDKSPPTTLLLWGCRDPFQSFFKSCFQTQAQMSDFRMIRDFLAGWGRHCRQIDLD